MELFDNINPIDFRYYGRNTSAFEKLNKYLSEKAFISYQLKVELALVKVLSEKGICDKSVYTETKKAIDKVSAEEVYKEEDRIHHNIRALVNCIRKNISDKAKPFIHFTATSYDIVENANSLRYKDVAENVVIPDLLELEKTLIELAVREKNTLQIGRTHGQHAEPITFGFTISGYVSRLGNRIKSIKASTDNLRGKFSGAVGCYNASGLFFKDPEEFEKAVLKELDLKPCLQSSQIAEPEHITDFIHSIISGYSVLANIADDMRNLQRSEINEVAEIFGKKQVGSSTMPHKRNPINFENVKSMYKEFMPRIITRYLDQISDHQRDLTNSASSRFIPEIIAAFVLSVNRLNKIMSKLVVDKDSLNKNFEKNKNMIAAEPAYILLAAHGHPDAHEYIREKTLESGKTGTKLNELLSSDSSVKKYLEKFTKEQIKILENPGNYTGIAAKKTEKVCDYWKKELNL
ncbi:adenylosuccinate lyase [Candidatus Woesearchaeota archaeon]|nr:adenylosuccinate lyase [Candidatus Woesearchaeota archaeon]